MSQGESTLRPFRSLVFILQLKRKFLIKLIVTDSLYALLCKYLLKVGFFAAEKGQFAFRNKIIEQGFTMLTIFFIYINVCFLHFFETKTLPVCCWLWFQFIPNIFSVSYQWSKEFVLVSWWLTLFFFNQLEILW